MLKFNSINSIPKNFYESFLFFSFSDEKEVLSTFKSIEKLLEISVPDRIKKSVSKNSESQNSFYLDDGSLVFIQKCEKKAKFNSDTLRRASASAVKKLISMKLKNVIVSVSVFDEDSVKLNFTNHEYMLQSVLEGLSLGSYKYDWYLSENKRTLPNISVFYPKLRAEKINSVISSANKLIRNVFLARDLQNTPASDLYPEILASKVKSLAKKNSKVKVKVFDLTEIKKRKMGGLEAVGKGSERKPKFIIIEYFGTERKKAPYIIIGKGVTFDSGGISIKPASGMWEMKGDMSGAATTIAVLFAAAELKLKVNLVGLVPAAENMPSGSSMRPGDIIRTASGKSIEIDNTDAEGRLILADALEYAVRYKPKTVIDLATLTGACVVALGQFASGLFTHDDELSGKLVKASNLTGERTWRLPLWDDYHKLIKSDFADVKNVGGKWGGAITAACFLEKFVDEKYKWAHIDIAGPAFAEENISYTSKTMTGYGVRLLIQYLIDELKH
ncbi:MAG: leucyl aminopeptidase [Ignavibacteria bacterium]|nr:leucyl aminopeptidase [Ignavibacteria bacterium]